VTENANLVMMFGYAHGGYLMARTTPSPDGVIIAVTTTRAAVQSLKMK
jgi:hypothetical protein